MTSSLLRLGWTPTKELDESGNEPADGGVALPSSDRATGILARTRKGVCRLDNAQGLLLGQGDGGIWLSLEGQNAHPAEENRLSAGPTVLTQREALTRSNLWVEPNGWSAVQQLTLTSTIGLSSG